MGNNQEIRQRMETYRIVLLVLNWIGTVILFIVGIVLANSRYTQGMGIGVIIGSIVIGMIGHFLINIALAIPFILLNNGDYLVAIANEKKQLGINDFPIEKQEEPVVEKNNNSISTTKEIKSNTNSESKNAEVDRLEKLFESTTDEKEKSLIAKQLYELGQTYYWRFIPK